MFAIIITEKGGNERREVFDRTEINVGRVQNNELVLPKGNVSKHHARLLYRDGRFIVTDLKSTNGTYVNGRKIAQATIVREGDKIYVGDFILRVEELSEQHVVDSDMEMSIEEVIPEPPMPSNSMSMRGSSLSQPPGARPGSGKASNFPLHSSDDLSWSSSNHGPGTLGKVPGPARVPAHVSRAPTPPAMHMMPNELTASVKGFTPPISDPSSGLSGKSTPSSLDAPVTSPNIISVPPTRLAAVSLIVQIEQSDLASALQTAQPPSPQITSRIDKSLRDGLASLHASRAISPQVDVEACVHEAQQELLGLGMIGSLLQDDSVQQIHVRRYNWITTLRSQGLKQPEYPLASEASLKRIIHRLVAVSDAPIAPGEAIVERRLPQYDASMTAVLDPVATAGAMLTLVKRSKANPTLEELVRAGAMSRVVSSFVASCIVGSINMLVSIAPGVDESAALSGLLSVVPQDHHALVLHDAVSIPSLPNNATGVTMSSTDDGALALATVTQLQPDSLFVAPSVGVISSGLLNSISEGSQGVVAFIRAPTLRHALARVAPQIVGQHPATSTEAVREWINASFDIGIELVRMRDGRMRVARVAELAGVEGSAIALRDIFTFSVDRIAAGGAIEGSFHPTGVVPRVAEQLQARGVPLDATVFRR